MEPKRNKQRYYGRLLTKKKKLDAVGKRTLLKMKKEKNKSRGGKKTQLVGVVFCPSTQA